MKICVKKVTDFTSHMHVYFRIGKVITFGSRFYILQAITSLIAYGIYSLAIAKKINYRLKYIKRQEYYDHFVDKLVRY